MICVRSHNSSSWKLYVKWEITLGYIYIYIYIYTQIYFIFGYICTYIVKYKNIFYIYSLHAFRNRERYTNL